MTEANKIVRIPTADRRTVSVIILGTTPLITNRFNEASKQSMFEKQTQAARACGHGIKEPRKLFLASIYYMPLGHGLPASAFGKACADATSSMKGAGSAYTKTAVRQSIRVEGQILTHDGLAEGSIVTEELVPLITGLPRMREDIVRVGGTKPDIHYRAQYNQWAAELLVHFNPSVHSQEQVLGLIDLAGQAVGVGDWRPQKNGPYGQFRVARPDDDARIAQLLAERDRDFPAPGEAQAA